MSIVDNHIPDNNHPVNDTGTTVDLSSTGDVVADNHETVTGNNTKPSADLLSSDNEDNTLIDSASLIWLLMVFL